MTDEELCKDARLAAKCLKDTDTFPTGQGIFLDCADRIDALTKRLTAMGEQADKDMAFIGDYIIANGNLLAERDALEAKLAKAVEGLREWDDLIKHQYSGSREAMSDMTYAAQHTAALLAEIEGEKT